MTQNSREVAQESFSPLSWNLLTTHLRRVERGPIHCRDLLSMNKNVQPMRMD